VNGPGGGAKRTGLDCLPGHGPGHGGAAGPRRRPWLLLGALGLQARVALFARTHLAHVAKNANYRNPPEDGFAACDLGRSQTAKSADASGVTLDFSRPGKPADNTFVEVFNGRFRAECLDAHWFLSLADARQRMEDWRRYDNEERPHGAIGDKPPITLMNRDGAASPPSCRAGKL
jgi:transposase InsO family protein